MRGFFIFEGTPSFLKKYQKGTPSLLIAVPQPQVILERPIKKQRRIIRFYAHFFLLDKCTDVTLDKDP